MQALDDFEVEKNRLALSLFTIKESDRLPYRQMLVHVDVQIMALRNEILFCLNREKLEKIYRQD